MRMSELLGLAGNLIGIGPLTWAIRRLAARRARARSSKLSAGTGNTVTIEIRSDRPQHATSVTASVTFSAVQQHTPHV